MTDDHPSKKEAPRQKFADLRASNFQKHTTDKDGNVANIATNDGDVRDARLTLLHRCVERWYMTPLKSNDGSTMRKGFANE